MSYLLDTNVISETVKPRPDAGVIAWLDEVDDESVFLSVATFAEVRRGIELLDPGRRRQRLSEWVESNVAQRFEGRILTVDAPLAHRWGRVRARAQKSGLTIEAIDALLAATAEAHGLTLVTRDVRHFEGLGIEVFSPWQSESAEHV